VLARKIEWIENTPNDVNMRRPITTLGECKKDKYEYNIVDKVAISDYKKEYYVENNVKIKEHRKEDSVTINEKQR
jgi:hypothetical protein